MEVRLGRAFEEGAASALPISPQHCPLMCTDPMASFCPCHSLSEGLCWPQECSRLSCLRQTRELMPLGVASTNVELVNKYPVVLPLAFDSCEARCGHSPRGLRAGELWLCTQGTQ